MPLPLQNRILLGITFFFGIMVLIGWIAINEGGRMSVFTDQYNGRSLENGAVTFQNNCSTCHGMDGKGITGRAPGLVNPMLFADTNPAIDAQAKIKDIQTQLDAANVQVQNIATEQTQLTALQTQLAAETDATKKAAEQAAIDKLNGQITRDQANLPTVQKSVTDLQTQLTDATAKLKMLTDQGWDPTRPPRLKELNWGGTLQAYIANAVAAGRPLSGLYWNGVIMPTWGQAYGGPLRTDEVDDVTNYVLNFRDQALKTTPKQVNQQFAIPVQASAGTTSSGTASAGGPDAAAADHIFTKFGKDANNAVANLGDLSGGNATNGETLYNQYGCTGCHLNGSVGPITKGTYYRDVTVRVKDPAIAAQKLTPEQYLAQSIIYPNAYIVPSYNAGVMPQNFGDRMSIQQLKDVIAYLKTMNTP